MRLTAAVIVTALSGYVAACGSFAAKPDPTRFFILSARSGTDGVKVTRDGQPEILGLGPVRLPGYLDRQEVVTRKGENRFMISEHDRWAEPLEENFTRVLAQNLAGQLGANRIVLYPWTTYGRPPRFVTLEVLRFESDDDRHAHLAGQWSVIDSGNKTPLVMKVSRLTRQTKDGSTEASVAALSELVGDLSREIAGTLGQIELTK
jgi:uncharacterized lipoprotein YmbA